MSTLTPAAESLAITSREYVGNPGRKWGWRSLGVTTGVDAVLDVIAGWHNGPDSGHTGAFRTCDEQPCYGARRVATDGWKGR